MRALPKLSLRRVVSEAIVDAWQRLCRLGEDKTSVDWTAYHALARQHDDLEVQIDDLRLLQRWHLAWSGLCPECNRTGALRYSGLQVTCTECKSVFTLPPCLSQPP